MKPRTPCPAEETKKNPHHLSRGVQRHGVILSLKRHVRSTNILAMPKAMAWAALGSAPPLAIIEIDDHGWMQVDVPQLSSPSLSQKSSPRSSLSHRLTPWLLTARVEVALCRGLPHHARVRLRLFLDLSVANPQTPTLEQPSSLHQIIIMRL
jgi:hypothetical protein